MMENRRFQIKVEGSAVQEGQISFALLGQILKGIQDTVYYLALAELQHDYRQRIRVPLEVKKACAIYRVLEEKGSYCLTAEIAPAQRIGEIEDIGLSVKEKYLEVVNCLKESSLEGLKNLIPDSNYRRKVLRTIVSYCPKNGAKWHVGIGAIGQIMTILRPELARSIRDILVPPASEQKTISGELVQIHLDENTLGLFYAPAQKVIRCTYDPELEDFIVSNVREIIQVHGKVQMDSRGIPEKIVDVLEIEEIDVSPLEVSEIHADGHVLMLHEELSVPVVFDPESQEFTLDYQDVGIVLGAENREDLLAEFCADFYWVWQEYGKDVEGKMSKSAEKLRSKIRDLVKEEKSL
ncbi:hypothetical protein BuS5_00975 [Desulfosarcina sp. BuS5]|nr:hypothetical protein BuS5_00975 [Desulfosarcina sp. BuS5]